MQAFLDHFAATLPKSVHAALLLDGAGWHIAGHLAVPDNISLVFLPPYAPEPNPVERLWLFLRECLLSHRLLESYEAIVDACCAAWNWLMRMPDQIATITARPWAQVKV